MPTALVLDYGFSRPHPLMQALAAVGVRATLSANPHDLRGADVVVVPDGDDSDRALSQGVSESVIEGLRRYAQTKRPLLSVGFGSVLLLSGHAHAAMPEGVGLFNAPVTRFDPRMVDEHERPLKSPHTGYTYVVGLDRHPLCEGVVPEGEKGAWFYFRHRLCAPARVPFSDVAVAHHGVPFAGAMWKERALALQFLPELSGPVGMTLLEGWARGLGL